MTASPSQDHALTNGAEPEANTFGGVLAQSPACTEKKRRFTDQAGPVSSPSHGATTIYFEISLDGHVHIYEMTEEELLLKVGVEARASFVAMPETIDQAHDYLQLNAYCLEMFETLKHAETWAEEYCGFRAGEVRAELRRYEARRAAYYATIRPAA